MGRKNKLFAKKVGYFRIRTKLSRMNTVLKDEMRR
jgi:hypothetical protein